MTIPDTIRSTYAATLLTLLLLTSCLQNTQPSTPAVPIDPPADAPTGLVYGMTASPIYEALKSQVKMTVSDGSQKATDFDVVILDGNGFTGQQLSRDEVVRNAVVSGIWVLALDVAEEDKVGLGGALHASSKGGAEAYLVRQGLLAARQPTSRLIEFENPDQEPEYVAKQIVDYVGADVVPQQVVPGNIPSRALTYFVHHTSDHSGPAPQVNNPFFNGRYSSYPPAESQVFTWTVDHIVSVFLDASRDPKGDFQHVLVDVQGRGNPGSLAIDNIDNCSAFAVSPDDPSSQVSGNCEIAWIQTRYDASVVMPIESGLTLIKNSPTNTNNSQTVTSGGYSFSVGYSPGDAPGLNFDYTSPTMTTTITDWEVNDQSDTSALWSYASNTVYDGMITSGYDSGAWEFFVQGVAPKHPNDLAVSDVQYATESYWTNNQIVEGTITITGKDAAWLTDAYVVLTDYDVAPRENSPYCIDACVLTQHMARNQNVQPWALVVDMSAVIPVPTESLTFSQNPVAAGETVAATLTLARPTPIPAEVLITSDNEAMTPANDSYIIPANEATLTFDILTGADTCQPVSGTIKAFYADGQNAVLTITPQPNCS